MKKLSALLICVYTLVSCSDNSVSHDYIEKKKYDIENAVDGKYTVIYTQTSTIPDDLLDIKIKKDDDVIFTFRTDKKGQYKLPEKVAYLFNYDGEKVYYVQNYKQETSGMTEIEPFCWLSRCFDDDCVSINISDSDSAYEKLRKTSEFLHENITEQEIIDIFDKCGYDDQYILEIYRYSGKD
ncbi:MAG: hypothetical protein K2J32_02405 [Ruminococcus sp.]|nr:hypothetical protein [Ruminococcus sp.]